jgi:hypothetical protein
MSKHSEREHQATGETEEKRLIADVLRASAEYRKTVESSTPPCPECDQPGTYHKEVSDYYGGRPVYQCANNHTFFWRFELNQGAVIKD